ADNGQHQFAAVLFGVGLQSITVTEVGSVAPLTDTRNVMVTPHAFTLTGFPSQITAGDVGAFQVVALDYFGNVATGYVGTGHCTSTDPKAALPGDYTFTAGDAGAHTFSASLVTAGTHSITVADTRTPSAMGTEDGIQVSPGAVSTFIIIGLPSSTQAGV